jgi:ferritin-like metal-binding protein YciE
MNKQEALKNFFEITLRGLLSGEKMLVEALDKLAEKASSDELKRALRQHQKETVKQVERLEGIFNYLDIEKTKNRVEEAEGVINKGKEALKSLANFSFKKGEGIIERLINQGDEVLEHFGKTEILNYAIASGNQLIEQAEILGYITAINMAEALGCEKVIEPLKRSLKEEKDAFAIMNEIAKKESEWFALSEV